MKDFLEKTSHSDKIMPKNCALVLEGGGTRTFYSAGVFDALIDAGILFPYIIGVSAGAANATSYISWQKNRNRIIAEQYVSRPEYFSKRNMLRHQSVFGFDYIFQDIPKKHVFFDQKTFDTADVRFLAGAMDCNDGQTVWFEKEDMKDGNFAALRASCSFPGITKMIKHKGYVLLDGGISCPIPIEQSIADGNTFHVIILTRNQGYVRYPFKYKRTLRLVYRKYPKLVEKIMKNHEVYNRQLALCEKLEKEGKALIIRPLRPILVSMLDKDTDKLLDLYDEGYKEGETAIERLKSLLMRDEQYVPQESV